VVVSACASGRTDPPATAVPSDRLAPSPTATLAPTGAPSSAATPTPSPATPEPGDPDDLALSFEPIVAGLDAPIGLAAPADGSGRIFVVEQPGRVIVVRDGAAGTTPFLDLSGRVSCCGERGLLGLAFHPDFPADPRLFVDYTDADGNTVVASVEVGAGDPERADPATLTTLLTVGQPFGNHNGGQLAFGPEGFLHVALGDGGSAGDPLDAGQRRDTLLGKILRIDVDATSGGAYGIPASNPFVDIAGARPEILHHGLRNPWRFGFDRVTGDLWIGDVGQNRYEEIDVARVGATGLNFGWDRMEGFHCHPSGEGCERPELTLPITEYGHDLGCSVTGGFVYRGAGQPAMAGLYLFADYCSGRFWAIDPRGDERRGPSLVGALDGNPAAFGEDEAGELFVADRGGRILRIVGSGGG
jgi:glucose/arabinose dehydrogenase